MGTSSGDSLTAHSLAVWLGIACLIALLLLASWWVHCQAGASRPDPIKWWRLVPAPHNFFVAPRPVRIAPRELTAGLLLHPSAAHPDNATAGERPQLLAATRQIRSDAQAILTGTTDETLVGIPAFMGVRMKYAAAAAGVLAIPEPDPDTDLPAGATEIPATSLTAHPTPGWLLGIDHTGGTVQVHLVPGSTILLHGSGADQLLDRLPPQCNWVNVIRGDVPATADQQDWVARWRASWSPGTCRIVVANSISDATRSNVSFDLSIDARGLMEHRNKRIEFSPVDLTTQVADRASFEAASR